MVKMATKKNRKGKIMIKHHRIKNLDNFLERYVEPIESVKLITPGAIKVGKGTGENLKVTYGREMYQGSGQILTGCKLNATSGNSNQEILVSTSKPEKVKEVIDKINKT
jgi:phosphoribosyl-dephospho-CoA transferase|tara:strand:- start:476 stop:802 length:327 start_codon:yes stop_codon:yes gene_type:complete